MHDNLKPAGGIDTPLTQIRGRYPDADPEMVAEVVRAVLGTMQHDVVEQHVSLLAAVRALGDTISTAKAEIAALRVDDITGSQIPSATDELDAIVAHTAAATDVILETCETLDKVASALDGPLALQLQNATTNIYEACGFQDITGQRITKVVATLQAIEARVTQMVNAFGGSPLAVASAAGETTRVAAAPSDAAALLNGPQLPSHAMDQSDIDRLLGSFD
jgi:chemotaxis protein CheZ